MNVLLVDDHPLILAALQAVIASFGNDDRVTCAQSAAQARVRLREHPDVVNNVWAKGAVQNRIGSVEELVGATVYLASDAASFTTGEIITIDGGLTLR